MRWFHVRGHPERDATGRIVRWYNTIDDIHDLKVAQAELSLIVETIPALVWCASPDGRITYINQRILDFCGMTFEDLAPAWWEMVHADDREASLRAWRLAVTTGSPCHADMRLRGKDGFYRWVHSMAQLGRDHAGNPTRWYGIFIDIDEQKRIEGALSETRVRLNRAAQIATVAELSASIAHEINQPLTAIVSNGEACVNWLATEPPNLERARRAAARVVRDGTHAGEIIKRLRTLFKLGHTARVPLLINDLVGEVLDLVRSEATRRRVSIRTELDRDLPEVPGDRVQLQQVVLNLLNNALDAMDAVVTRHKVLSIRTAVDPAGVVVEVSDTGVGLDDLDQLCEPFFTTKARGMGMGLAVTRSIVEAHAGRLWATRRDPHGTCFHFVLPLDGQP